MIEPGPRTGIEGLVRGRFLGPASYVRHQGERPMAITWRLHHALPGDLFTSFAAAVA